MFGAAAVMMRVCRHDGPPPELPSPRRTGRGSSPLVTVWAFLPTLSGAEPLARTSQPASGSAAVGAGCRCAEEEENDVGNHGSSEPAPARRGTRRIEQLRRRELERNAPRAGGGLRRLDRRAGGSRLDRAGV